MKDQKFKEHFEEKFSEALGNIDDKYLKEVLSYSENQTSHSKKKYTWKHHFFVAACILLILGTGIDTLSRLDVYIGGNSSGVAGTVLNGDYYYEIRFKGIYRYTPDQGSKLVLHTYWFTDWYINDYGIYYVQGRTIGVVPHTTGKREHLCTVKLTEQISSKLQLQEDGTIFFQTQNIFTESNRDILIDGKTGEHLELDTTPLAFDNYSDLLYEGAHLTLGTRDLEFTFIENDFYHLLENGTSIIPESILLSGRPYDIGNNLWFTCHVTDAKERKLYVLRPNGNDSLIDISDWYLHQIIGTDDYLFLPHNGHTYDHLDCFEIQTGERWCLETNIQLDSYSPCTLYSIETDGTYLYSTTPWRYNIHACWRLIFDENDKPVGLELLNEDILKN